MKMVIKVEILNRKANFDYAIEDTYEAGIALKGTEVKSIRNGKANIKDSYAIVKNHEVYLLNMFIKHYEEGNIFNHNESSDGVSQLHGVVQNEVGGGVTVAGGGVSELHPLGCHSYTLKEKEKENIKRKIKTDSSDDESLFVDTPYFPTVEELLLLNMID